MFVMWWRFQYVIKIMADIENILNDLGLFGDTVDTPKEGIEQNRKRECLKSIISKGNTYLLGGKHRWIHERVNKASDETINKIYAGYE